MSFVNFGVEPVSDDLLAANMRYDWAVKQYGRERDRNKKLLDALIKIRAAQPPFDDETKSDFTIHDLIDELHLLRSIARDAIEANKGE